MKIIVSTVIFVLTVFTIAKTQDYQTGFGLRGGWSNGITIKHFIQEDKAIEGILSSRWRGLEITGLYEIHDQAFNEDRLNWYYGFGGHVGLYQGDNGRWSRDDDNFAVLGVDGILGIEYNFRKIPINISLDWKPVLNLIGYFGLWTDSGAFSIRFII